MASEAADLLASLDELFERSRSADGRAALAGAGRPRALALLLPTLLDECLRERSEAAIDRLVCVLRTLRNACAGVDDAKTQLHDARCAEHLARLLCTLARESALERRSLLLATAVQVLGNSCVQHARNQEATWTACFPSAFAETARTTGSDVHSALCMVLFVCCRRQPERLLMLCSGLGAELVALLLASSKEALCIAAHEPQSPSAAEWLLFLLGEVCACGHRFMLLYAALGSELAGATAQGCGAPTSGQALLLHAAAGAAEIRETASSSPDEQPETSGLLRHAPAFSLLLAVIERAADSRIHCARDDLSVTTLAGGLHLLRNVAAGSVPQDDDAFVQPVLQCARLVVACLACLAAPEGPRPRARAVVTEPDISRAETAEQTARYPQRPPYVGYRRDLVATIASLSHGNAAVVREVVAAGGVLTVVQQCRGDAEDTFVREWALWAVRNMCEVSADAQQVIRELDALSAPTLDAMG